MHRRSTSGLRRGLGNAAAVLSLLLCVGVCVLWVCSQSGYNQAAWRYDRYLADGSAASSHVYVKCDQRRLWLRASWGEVEPYNGSLVWGYYINADRSGGRPQFRLRHERYDPNLAGWGSKVVEDGWGWGPVRLQAASRSRPKDGDDHTSIGIGVSYWLLAVILAIPPTLALRRWLARRRRARVGRCRSCGYDLRATPDRCPECGAIPKTAAQPAV